METFLYTTLRQKQNRAFDRGEKERKKEAIDQTVFHGRQKNRLFVTGLLTGACLRLSQTEHVENMSPSVQEIIFPISSIIAFFFNLFTLDYPGPSSKRSHLCITSPRVASPHRQSSILLLTVQLKCMLHCMPDNTKSFDSLLEAAIQNGAMNS